MKNHFPPSVRVVVLATTMLGLFIGSSFSFPSTGAPIFPSVSPGISSFLNEWLRPEARASYEPRVSTDKNDYAPYETAQISGSGFAPYESVTLLVVHITPPGTESVTGSRVREADHAGHTPWQVMADENGNFSSSWLVQEDSLNQMLLLSADQAATDDHDALHADAIFTDANESAGLDQCANDPAPSPSTDGCSAAANDWVNGNIGSSKANYSEGDSIPYRLSFDNLPLSSHSVTIEWDTTKSSKHAIDYLTTFSRTVATADPCLGVSGCTLGSFSTFAIPADSQVTGGGVTPVAGNFTLFGGTITAVSAYSYADGAGFTGDKSARITITFTASQANPVLAWGGHIATRQNWGSTNSAVAISGSPYHTRLIDLDGAGGNQDRSLSADAVIFPGSITIIKEANPEGSTSFGFTASPSPLTNFSLVDDGSSTDTRLFGNITNFQTYNVAESLTGTWALEDIVCDVTSPNGGSQTKNVLNLSVAINLKEGENVTCRFKNKNDNLLNGRIIVDKVTVPSTDTTIFDFTASYDADGFQLRDADTPNDSGLLTPGPGYSVTEAGNSNYESSVSCVSDVAGKVVPNSTSITLQTAETVTCTFTNKKKPSLKLVKNVVGGIADASAWTLSASGTGGFSAQGTPATGSTASVGPNLVTVDQTYTLGESGGPSGYTASDYSCVTTPFGGVAGSPVSGNSITLAAGESAVCTITNTRDQGYFKIKKVFDPLTSGFAGDFTIHYDCGGTNTGDVNVAAGITSSAIGPFDAGTSCAVSEPSTPTPPTGWTFGAPSVDISPVTIVKNTAATTATLSTVTNSISRDLGSLKINKVFDPLTSGYAGTFAINYDCNDGTTHDGTLNLAAGGTQTIGGIPTGTSCVVSEPTLPTAPANWTFGTPTLSDSQAPTTDGTVVITTKATTYEVTVTNSITRDLGNFKITKNTSNPDGATLPTNFTGTYDCGTGYTGTWSIASPSGSKTINDIPTGNTCSVTEDALAPISGYTWGTPSFTPTSIQISTKGGTFEIVVGNSITRDLGNFKITKNTSNPDGATLPTSFTGTYNCGTGYAGTWSVANGGFQTVTGIPTGNTCSVTEDALSPISGYTWGTPTFTPTSIVVSTKGGTFEIVVGNSITRDKGSLVLAKSLTGGPAGYTGPFTIHWDCGTFGNGNESVSAGGSATVSNIPTGTSCTVSETPPTPPQGYTFGTPTFSPQATVTIPGGNGSSITVTTNNSLTRDLGNFKITKATTNNDGATLPANFTGTYNCGTGYTGTWSIASPSGSQTINNIPTGNSCSITEDALAPISGYTWGTPSISPASVTIDTKGGTFEITVTNSITRNRGTFTIAKTLSNPDGAAVPASFSVNYNCGLDTDGSALTGSKSIAPGSPAAVSGVPTGNTCSVTEVAPAAIPNFTWGTITYTPASIVIADTSSEFKITVGNSITRDKGYFKIRKVFNALTSGFAGNFTIHYDCGAGDQTVSLAAGVTSSAIGPFDTGTSCTISEPVLPTAPAGWTFGTPSIAGSPVTIVKSNTYTTTLATVTNSITRNVGSLKITKSVVGAPSGFTGSFTVDVTCTGDGGSYLDRVIDYPTPGYVQINGIPTGNTCTVTEDTPTGAPTGYSWTTPVVSGTATISAVLSEITVANTVTARAKVLKLTNGAQDPNMIWNFTLKGSDVDASDSTPPALMDFNNVALTPGTVYTVCETGLPPTWTSEWKVDTDNDGVADMIIPFVPNTNDSPIPAGEFHGGVYDPKWVAPDANGNSNYINDTRCVKFKVGPGRTLVFQVNNSRPGGEPRTIGYWKNWNTCTGGGQVTTAQQNGGTASGWYILDNLLNNPGYHFGDPIASGNKGLQLDGNATNFILYQGSTGWKSKTDCQAGVLILDKSDVVSGKKAASDPAYNMAAQLFAAMLNLSAGAESCQAAINAVNQGNTLLTNAHFNGTGTYKVKSQDATSMNTVARTLDQYNNGNLCP